MADKKFTIEECEKARSALIESMRASPAVQASPFLQEHVDMFVAESKRHLDSLKGEITAYSIRAMEIAGKDAQSERNPDIIGMYKEGIDILEKSAEQNLSRALPTLPSGSSLHEQAFDALRGKNPALQFVQDIREALQYMDLAAISITTLNTIRQNTSGKGKRQLN